MPKDSVDRCGSKIDAVGMIGVKVVSGSCNCDDSCSSSKVGKSNSDKSNSISVFFSSGVL